MRTTRHTLLYILLTSILLSNSYGQGIKVTFTPSTRFFQGFGNVTVGKSKTQTIIITRTDANPGSFACIITPPKTGSFSVPGNLNFNLGVGESDTIPVIFHPMTLGGPFRDTILFTHNADTSAQLKNPVVYALSGSGIPEDTNPKITLSIGGGGFGYFLNVGSVPVGKISSTPFTIKNTSDTIRTLTGSVGTTFTSNYSVVSGGGSFTLDTGKSVTVTVSFTPDTIRNFIDSLIITSNSSSPNNRIKVTIFGQGAKADTFPQITLGGLFGGRVSFGNDTIPKTKTVSFIIRNSSQLQTTLIGNVGSPLNTNIFSVTAGGGAFSLDSGATKMITVSFTADSVGIFRDTMIITTNSDSPNQSIKIALSGTGVIVTGPKISVQPLTLAFGTQFLNTGVLTLTTTIKNLADSAKDSLVGVISFPQSPFSISSGGGAFTIPQSDSLHLTVAFTTTSTPLGGYSDSVIITSNSNDNAKRVVVHVTGAIYFLGAVAGKKEINYIAAVPNPFNGKTTISFSLSESSPVSMKIFDMLGEEVFSSPESIYSPGVQQLEWNAARFTNGEYLCVLNIGKETRTIRVILSK